MSRDWTSAGRRCVVLGSCETVDAVSSAPEADCVLVEWRWVFRGGCSCAGMSVETRGVHQGSGVDGGHSCLASCQACGGAEQSKLLLACEEPHAFVSRHAGAVTSIHITSRLPCRATARLTILGSSRNNHVINNTQWPQKILAHCYAQLVKNAE